ncbi:MAG: VOC family protein, partial [Caulobacterales bacterium]
GALDLDLSIAFYETLGFQLIVKTEHYARLIAPEGGATLSLRLQESIATENAPVLYLESDKLDAEITRLKAAGIVFESELEDKSWLWREAYLRDPAGNKLCLYFAGVNRIHPPWRIQGNAEAPIYHIIVQGFEGDLLLVKRRNVDYRQLQTEFPDYLTSLGPHTLHEALEFIREEWPEFFRAQAQNIRIFAESEDTDFKLS